MAATGRRYAEDWTHEHAQEVIWGHYKRVIDRSRNKMRDRMISDSMPRPAFDH
jgi:hypothetical protein